MGWAAVLANFIFIIAPGSTRRSTEIRKRRKEEEEEILRNAVWVICNRIIKQAPSACPQTSPDGSACRRRSPRSHLRDDARKQTYSRSDE
jgi:hypothetical protein